MDVLLNPDATHDQRLWMVGFLIYVGYTASGILSIITQLNQWSNFSPWKTRYQVHWLVSQHSRDLKDKARSAEIYDSFRENYLKAIAKRASEEPMSPIERCDLACKKCRTATCMDHYKALKKLVGWK